MALVAACAILGGGSPARAQDIEPRAYSNAPLGVNFAIVGYAYTQGSLAFDSSIPITDPNLTTSSALIAYARVLDFRGMSAKFDASAPFTWLAGTATYDGEPVQRNVTGFADARFRLSVNFLGAPALSLPEYRGYRQDLLVGASLQVSAPVGQYDNTRLVNLGTNRWYFKPEVGVSQAVGRWTLEGAFAASFFTDNTDFYNGSTRSQAPLFSFQAHVVRAFRAGIWGAFDAIYFTGGRTTIDGTQKADLQQNWRLGGTLAYPVDAHNSLKLTASSGVSARTGNNMDLFGVAWQYRWGGGL